MQNKIELQFLTMEIISWTIKPQQLSCLSSEEPPDFITFSRPLWYHPFQNKTVYISSVIPQTLHPVHHETCLDFGHKNQIIAMFLAFHKVTLNLIFKFFRNYLCVPIDLNYNNALQKNIINIYIIELGKICKKKIGN